MEKIIKQPRYREMQCKSHVKCPCYKGDGYRYCFDAIEFLFCEECNNKLLIQMLDQKKLERELDKLDEEEKSK